MLQQKKYGWLLDPLNGTAWCRSEIGTSHILTPGGVRLDQYLIIPTANFFEPEYELPPEIPLLYTFKSDICYESFQYQLDKYPEDIELIKLSKVDEKVLDYDEEYDETDPIGWTLDLSPRTIYYNGKPVQETLAAIIQKLNQGIVLTQQEIEIYAEATSNYSSPETGSYPFIDVTSQIFGTTFLNQRPDIPECLVCGWEMEFCAALERDARLGTTFMPSGYHAVFYLCVYCRVVHAQHFA